MFEASYDKLPLFTRISISSLWEWPKDMIINEFKDANESAEVQLGMRNDTIPEKY